MRCKKSPNIYFLFLLSLLLALQFLTTQSYAQQFGPQSLNFTKADTTAEKPVQYRRGIELNENFQSYEEKYASKNLYEEKRRLFPLQSTGVWSELNPRVPRVDYLGIQFVNKDTGWAVGDLGALIKSTDGGTSWIVSETNTTTPILKVRSFNGQVVIASGFGGLILRSTNEGETFTQVTSNVTGDLWGLQMINDTLGWACGNANSLAKTTDGGQTWQRIFTPGYTSDYWWIDFLTESYGFIAANGKVLKTIDGGQNWEIIEAGDAYPLFSIDVIDSLHIAAAGYGGTGYVAKNIYSSDAGYTWINGGQLTNEAVNCIQFVSPDTGYLVMTNVSARKTTNRGQSWTTIQGISDNYELQLLVESNIGYSSGAGLKINKADGNLDEWNRLIINDNFSDVFFVSEQNGFVISSSGFSAPSGLYKTTDSGINWQKHSSGLNGVDLLFLDSLSGFIAGSTIYKSTSGGENWFTANISVPTGPVVKIFFINSTIGWAITNYSSIQNVYILKSTDSGENWFEQYSNLFFPSFTSINFVDSLYGWISCLNGYPYKTTDGGLNWIEQTNSGIGASRDVFFIDYQNGFLLESNKLYKTIDGGSTWVQNQNLTGFSLAELSTYEDSTIFIIGYKTYRSKDGGENWDEFTELNGTRITGLNLLNAGFGFAVGEQGLIMEYYDSLYVPVELISFIGETIGNRVVLGWRTASEINNKGFEIERKEFENQVWNNIGFAEGHGTTTEKNKYSHTDFINKPGKYYYRLKQIDYNGNFEYSNVVEVTVQEPRLLLLSQNYPNPFNNATVIIFQIPTDEFVTLNIYDVLGNKIKTLIAENKKAGYYTINYSANDLSSGIYFYKLTSGDYSQTKKFILLK